MWSISVGDFNSCVCGVCDCLHKTQAQRYSECVLALHEIMFRYLNRSFEEHPNGREPCISDAQ